MARPAAILTRRVTFGPASSLIGGVDLTMAVSFAASVSGVVWAATGAPLIGMLETVTTEPGMQAYVDLPLPGQAGFIDGNGNEIRDWTYRAVAVYLDGVRRVGDGNKVFSLVAPAEGEAAEVDLDTMIPATSNAGVTVFIPDAWTRLVEDAAELVAGFPASDTLPRYVGGELQTPDGDPIAVGADEATLVAIDADPESDLRVQQDGRLADALSPKLDADKRGVAGGVASLDGGARVPAAQLPARLGEMELSATFVPRWAPTTDYALGAKVVSPSGVTVTAKAAFTSGAAYSAANWNLPAELVAKASVADVVTLRAAAKNPDLLVVGAVTGDPLTSAQVVWPDDTPGVLTITARHATGAVTAYNITYGSPVTKTFTQPAITRATSGAPTNVPQIVVT